MSGEARAAALARVAVVGTSCSGKTHFARRLAAAIDTPHVELDALHWKPNWVERPDAELRSLVEHEVAGERWVIDGNYSVVRDVVWGRATDVVWLNYPFRLVFSRAWSRTVRRVRTGEELFSGNRESLRQSFFSRDSILLWVIQTHRKNRARYARLKASETWRHLRFWEFRQPGEAEAFLARCRERD